MNTWTGIGLGLCAVLAACLAAGIGRVDEGDWFGWFFGTIAVTRCAFPFLLVCAFLSKGIDRLGIDRLFINGFLHVCAGFAMGIVALLVFRLNRSPMDALFATFTGMTAMAAYWAGTRYVHHFFWMRFFGIGVPVGYALLAAVAGLM